jgi:hypothetical protein
MILENHLKNSGSPFEVNFRFDCASTAPTDISRDLLVCGPPALNLGSMLRLGFNMGRLFTCCTTGARRPSARSHGLGCRTDVPGAVTRHGHRDSRIAALAECRVVRTDECVERRVPCPRRAQTERRRSPQNDAVSISLQRKQAECLGVVRKS